MVKGLEHFKKHFSEFTDCYVLIGGTACAKHKNDVVHLYKLLSSDLRIELSESIKKDMKIFLDYLKKDERMNLKNLDLEHTSLDELCNNLGKIYNLV